ncbi:MAG: 50S ribosomal protein L22 [Proteobacteria bacterium]|jgi:large subunit ribosomal protein L22|nr:50S ribosomal protein L22 [Pseudomonadota bacterium]
MSQSKNERRLPEDKAMAKASSIRSSARKLNLVAASIRGKSASAALTQLTFEKRRVANEVKKVLQSAIANAENNHSLDVDRLVVAEAWCGRSFVMKRFHARGRGKSAGIEKPFSNLTIVVQETKVGSLADQKKASRRAVADAKKGDAKKSKKVSTKKAAEAAQGA